MFGKLDDISDKVIHKEKTDQNHPPLGPARD